MSHSPEIREAMKRAWDEGFNALRTAEMNCDVAHANPYAEPERPMLTLEEWLKHMDQPDLPITLKDSQWPILVALVRAGAKMQAGDDYNGHKEWDAALTAVGIRP